MQKFKTGRETLTSMALESVRRAFSVTGSSPMLGLMNLASEITAVTSSSPSFLIFQFLSQIFDTISEVILSLKIKSDKKKN